LAWQTIGHGADAVLYWQWRAALNGQEQYHGAIVGPDGKPLPIYAEIAQLGHDLELTRDALAGTSPRAEIAILHDYDSRWAIDFQPHTKDYDQEQVLLRFYAPLQRIAQSYGQAVDIVDPSTAPLDKYKLLVAPSLNVIDDALAARFLVYVQQGGHLLLGPRSGMKDEFNSLNQQRQPGPLVEALGGRVEQYYALDAPVVVKLEHPPSPVAMAGCTFTTATGASSASDCGPFDELVNPTHANATIWAEALTASARDARVVLRYDHDAGWLADQPAMIARVVGVGSIAYLGTLPDAALMSTLLNDAVRDAHVAASASGSNAVGINVEICERSVGSGADARRVVIVINHNVQGKWITLAGHLRDLLPGVDPSYRQDAHGQPITQFTLDTQGVAVLVPFSEQEPPER
jgi:beta-galactosidase